MPPEPACHWDAHCMPTCLLPKDTLNFLSAGAVFEALPKSTALRAAVELPCGLGVLSCVPCPWSFPKVPQKKVEHGVLVV